MTLPARAAALRGDDYQHAIGWWWACKALDDPNIASVSIEDKDGGSFDDIVVRRTNNPSVYWQVKSSNYGNIVVDEGWLFNSSSEKGKSALQHFHHTWRRLRQIAEPFELALVTNRGYDGGHPILGDLRDLQNDAVNVEKLRGATPGSKAGKARKDWADHLGIEEDELLEFLGSVKLRSDGSEAGWNERAQEVMRNVGLRSDTEAVTIGKTLVRQWVKTGAGPQGRDALKRQVADKGLLARSGTVVFAVHAIDREPSRVQPTVELDIVHLYDGDNAFSRYQLRNPGDWNGVVAPLLREKVRELEAYGPRRAHVTGSMRLPLWFAVGRALPEMRRWVVSLDQKTEEWSTAAPQAVTPRVLTDRDVGNGTDLVVGIGLRHDPTANIESWVQGRGDPVGRLLVLGPDGEPGGEAVPCGGWAAGWARGARERIRSVVAQSGARRIHLFMAAPAGTALMLGHQWNMLPTTVVYEFVPHEQTNIETLTLR